LARQCGGEGLGELCRIRLVGLYGPSILEVLDDLPGRPRAHCYGTVPHAEWPVYVETSQAEWLLTLSRCGVAARNSRVPAIRERYCRARHDRKSTRVSFSLSRPTRPGDEIGGEVSASRTWWSTAARRWRGVDCQDAPAIRECLER
jgi:hypothetical protein